MSRTYVPYRSSVAVELEHPTDVVAEPREPLSNADDGATCTFKIYDPAKDEQLSADEVGGQVILSVTGAGEFVVGDLVEVSLDDGSLHATDVVAVDGSAGTVEVTDALPSAAAEGSRIRVRLGSEVSMSDYGTPALETVDWGFRGFIDSDHSGLDLDLEVDVEIYLRNSGGTLILLDVLYLTVKPNHLCEA